jgi:hypothetical protein
MAVSAIAALGAVANFAGSMMQQQAARKEARARRRMEQVRVRRERRQLIREAQLQRARALQTAQMMGVQQTSGVAGGVGALGSQVGSQLGYSSQMSGLSTQIEMARSQMQSAGMMKSFGGFISGMENIVGKPSGGPSVAPSTYPSSSGFTGSLGALNIYGPT